MARRAWRAALVWLWLLLRAAVVGGGGGRGDGRAAGADAADAAGDSVRDLCAHGGGWRSRSHEDAAEDAASDAFTRITHDDFFRAAACSVAAPALIFFSAEEDPATRAAHLAAWARAAGAVRRAESLALFRQCSTHGQGAEERCRGAAPELTLSVLDAGDSRSARALWARLRLDDEAGRRVRLASGDRAGGGAPHSKAAVLALFSTNDHAEGLALSPLPVRVTAEDHQCEVRSVFPCGRAFCAAAPAAPAASTCTLSSALHVASHACACEPR